jgi:hemerythrin-like domain-containing protein
MHQPNVVPAAIEHLLAEHDGGRRQFSTLRAAVAAGQTGRIAPAEAVAQAHAALDYLNVALELHISKEEGPLFPRLKAVLPDDDRLVDEMIAEHDLIRIKRDALRDVVLRVLNDDHDGVRAGLHALRDAVAGAALHDGPAKPWFAEFAGAVQGVVTKAEVHFQNEEELVFPLASQLLSSAALELIEAEIAVLDQAEG